MDKQLRVVRHEIHFGWPAARAILEQDNYQQGQRQGTESRGAYDPDAFPGTRPWPAPGSASRIREGAVCPRGIAAKGKCGCVADRCGDGFWFLGRWGGEGVGDIRHRR